MSGENTLAKIDVIGKVTGVLLLPLILYLSYDFFISGAKERENDSRLAEKVFMEGEEIVCRIGNGEYSMVCQPQWESDGTYYRLGDTLIEKRVCSTKAFFLKR